MNPITIKHDDFHIVPCGKCPQCLKRRASGWSFRLMQEFKRSSSAMFVTLTYNNDHLEFTRNRYTSLNKVTLQKFFKRLRKHFPKGHKIKYYAVGEYGGKIGRPHYHVILFNATYEAVEKSWAFDTGKVDDDGQSIYDPIGYIHYGDVNEASIGYCLKYMMKPGKVGRHAKDDRIKEFALMSKD